MIADNFNYSLSLLRDKLEGGIIGLLIGDALGVPYEFHDSKNIPPRDQINYIPPKNFDRSYKNIPPATWSDDGAQALCLLASLLHCGQFNLHDFGNRLLNWQNIGYMAIDYHVFDIGITTNRALAKLKNGIPPHLAGEENPESNGNGSLMRVLPLALWHRGTDEQLIQDAQKQSCITHRHLRSQICCALYCLYARRILQNNPSPWNSALATLHAYYKNNTNALEELTSHIAPIQDITPQGTGYVVDSLHAARYALSHDNYKNAVLWAISLGNDTDTTACIVGGIIGLRDGKTSIPKEWIEQLRGNDIYQPLIKLFLDQRSNHK